ncbi:hypothetical protein SUGI_0675560 [Cryptomeria japonica]|uniref:putative glycine-rich cell wall structural protein 1 n=1 Tax=Cryptomeria japonica TaxID=3369 RepID=UPI002414B0C8|nr:putative glycine-rich cell wall structural protein 1 [Cryptomeria japonica]GLJ33601.1 hypothetical protein SUGI_0675560 [Cryptomeria japonica]
MGKSNIYLLCFIWVVLLELVFVGCSRTTPAKTGSPPTSGGGNDFGFGVGYGVPGIPSNWGGVVGGVVGGGGVSRPSVVCSEKGPCYQKKLTCPSKCFKSGGKWGPRGGGGGGGGGCTLDCKKKCRAYC